ncbi:CLUMA_CG010782, isoform A [Clunio marinus]|uniref:CLUMA_CG010782, isoform A n=1 Tax=Clunio marinus TaxID=568069 RepID=A0A1J1IAX5_9DIPT|nr:CLUMA_CG010782, isoform A [Clunio marinus]
MHRMTWCCFRWNAGIVGALHNTILETTKNISKRYGGKENERNQNFRFSFAFSCIQILHN